MTFSIVHRDGGFEDEASVNMFSSLYDERFIEDDEHISVSVGHESEWYLSLYPDGTLIWENVADRIDQPRHMKNMPKEKVIDLWTKLANGEIEAFNRESWLIGCQ